MMINMHGSVLVFNTVSPDVFLEQVNQVLSMAKSIFLLSHCKEVREQRQFQM